MVHGHGSQMLKYMVAINSILVITAILYCSFRYESTEYTTIPSCNGSSYEHIHAYKKERIKNGQPLTDLH